MALSKGVMSPQTPSPHPPPPKKKKKCNTTNRSKSLFFQGLTSYRGGLFDCGLGGGGEGGGGGGGEHRIRRRECKLRPFHKLWYFRGIRSINMCYEDRNSNKISTKILDSGEFELMTAIYQVSSLANTPSMLGQYTRETPHRGRFRG